MLDRSMDAEAGARRDIQPPRASSSATVSQTVAFGETQLTQELASFSMRLRTHVPLSLWYRARVRLFSSFGGGASGRWACPSSVPPHCCR